MKRILCFGDSNTWGYEPATGMRHGSDVRWTGILSKTLGSGYEIIEEGLNGRTTVLDDPFEEYKNGRDYLIPCLESQRPLDLVILMLGTNDLKARFGIGAFDISKGVETLVKLIQTSESGIKGKPPAVLILAPPPVARLTDYAEMFEGADAKSRKLGEEYARVAGEMRCAYLDTSTIIVSSPLDGIHFEAEEHQKLGQTLASQVKKLIG